MKQTVAGSVGRTHAPPAQRMTRTIKDTSARQGKPSNHAYGPVTLTPTMITIVAAKSRAPSQRFRMSAGSALQKLIACPVDRFSNANTRWRDITADTR